MKQLKIVMLGDSLDKQGGIVTLEKLMLEQAPPYMEIQHIGTAVDGSSTKKVLAFGIALSKFVLQLLSTKVDLVHIHVADGGSAFRKGTIALIASVFRKPVILHSNSPEFHLFYKRLPQSIKKLLLWAFSKCDRFIAVSESWKNFYVHEFGLKADIVVVLANPIKLPAQVPLRTNCEDVNFLFLGRIGQRKGSFDLIKAFAALSDQHKHKAKLILAGDGEVELARDLVDSLSLTDCVTVFDWVNSQQRDALLAKADVFVLPTYNEGLPLALLEAMGWGLPVITTPVGGIPDVITQNKNGLLVAPGDIPQLSAAMQVLIENSELRRSLSFSARVSAMPFDIKNYFASLANIYCSISELSKVEIVLN